MAVQITLPQTPAPGRTLQELSQSLSVWTRQAQSAIRQIAAHSGSGGTPAVIVNADTTHTGLLTSTDWNTFNGKQAAGAYLLDALSDGSFYGRKNGAWTALVNADATHIGLLTSTDWNTFNGKQAAGAYLLDAPSNGSFYGRLNGAWSVLPVTANADATHTGLLTSTDWNTFNGKQAAGAYLLDAPSNGSFYGRLNGAWSSLVNADTTHTGLLTSTDWNTFNGKQAAGAYLLDAPSDGNTYGRLNGAWAVASGGGGGTGVDVIGAQVFS